MKRILHNAKIYVERGTFCQALSMEDGIITHIGSNEEIMKNAGDDCEIIDCGGRTVIPGLNDSHMHLLLLGINMREVKTDDVTSIVHLIERCREFIKNNPDSAKNGIHSIGWNQDNFTGEKRMPTKEDLDKISTEIPIVLERICGHILTVNTKALEILGMTEKAPDIPGGECRTGEDGKPNGIFTESACIVANQAIPPVSEEECEAALKKAMEYAVSRGLTTVQSNDVGSAWCNRIDVFKLFRDFYEEGKALLRYTHQMCFDTPEEFKEFLLSGEREKSCYGKYSWLSVGPLKLFKDGSLGARTALVRDGYVGDRDNHGIDWTPSDSMDRYCSIAKEYGVQVVTHCIGDEASSQTIDSYEKAFVDGENKLRHSLVHCQITDQALLDRIVEKGILVQAQPIFINFDMTILEDLCGQKLASTSYNFGTLLKRGVKLSYGTDCPVEDCDPFANIYTAVTRKGLDGKPDEGFFPEQCVDVETAIDAYTAGSAYNEFKEDVKGRLKPGHMADMVILDKDIFQIDPMEIKNINPVMTIVGGETVYSTAME